MPGPKIQNTNEELSAEYAYWGYNPMWSQSQNSTHLSQSWRTQFLALYNNTNKVWENEETDIQYEMVKLQMQTHTDQNLIFQW